MATEEATRASAPRSACTKLTLTNLSIDDFYRHIADAVACQSRLRRETIRRDGPYTPPRFRGSETVTELDFPRRVEAAIRGCEAVPFSFTVDLPGAMTLEGSLVEIGRNGNEWVAVYEVE